MKMLLVWIGIQCSSNAARIRHRDLSRSTIRSINQLDQSVSLPIDAHELWRITGIFASSFPSAVFPSTNTVLGMNYTDGSYSVGSLTSINLSTGNVDWSFPLFDVKSSFLRQLISVSHAFTELYYINYLSVNETSLCNKLMALKLRSITPLWQLQLCYDAKKYIYLPPQLLVYKIDGRDTLLWIERFGGRQSSPHDSYTLRAIDGLSGSILYSVENTPCVTSSTYFDPRGSANNPMLLVRDEGLRQATLWGITNIVITQLNVAQWDSRHNTLLATSGLVGGTVLLQQNYPFVHVGRAIDVLTNQTLWSADNVNNPLINSSWIISMFPNNRDVQITYELHPNNPEQVLITNVARNRTGDGSVVIVAGILDVNHGNLTSMTPIIGPLPGRVIPTTGSGSMWSSSAKGNNVMMSFYLGPDNTNPPPYWFAFTPALQLINKGVLDGWYGTAAILYPEVSATSVLVVYSVRNPTGLEAVKYDT